MKRYTREQLVHFLVKLSKELSRSPTIKEAACTAGMPSPTTYMKRFSSWNDALKEAGLKINVRNKYTKNDLTENLIALHKELGRQPSPKDLSSHKWAGSYSTYIKRFSTWSRALKEAGIKKEGLSSLKGFRLRKRL